MRVKKGIWHLSLFAYVQRREQLPPTPLCMLAKERATSVYPLFTCMQRRENLTLIPSLHAYKEGRTYHSSPLCMRTKKGEPITHPLFACVQRRENLTLIPSLHAYKEGMLLIYINIIVNCMFLLARPKNWSTPEPMPLPLPGRPF